MINRAEEVPDVGLEDELPSPRKRHPDCFQSIGGRPFRAKPETDRQEIGLEDRFENNLGCLLTHPITHRRNTQWPLGAIRFWYLHPAHRRRAVDACTKVCSQFGQHPIHAVVLNRRQGHTINPGSTTIGSHPRPRLPEDVAPKDAVIQSMETATLRLLGRSP